MATKTRTRKARSTRKSTPKKSSYELITEKIVELLEAGVAPWRKPWVGQEFAPANAFSRKPYRGINAFLLHCCSSHSSPLWCTYKQAQEHGGQVRAGEKGMPVAFFSWIDKRDKATGEVEERYALLKHYWAFNVDQCDWPEGKKPEIDTQERPPREHTPIEAAEAIVKGMPNPPRIEHGGKQCCYFPMSDVVRMPQPEDFDGAEEYYNSLLHELTHATGHKNRLNRPEIARDNITFADHEYSKEELVAEMGAAFLMGVAGLEAKTIENSAAYLQSWIRVLKGDSKLAIQAAAAAQKAADHIRQVKWNDED